MTVQTDATILASAVIILTGLAALARQLIHFRDDVRDNTIATGHLTDRMARVERALLRVWARLFPDDPLS
jgi:hypothetical protein